MLKRKNSSYKTERKKDTSHARYPFFGVLFFVVVFLLFGSVKTAKAATGVTPERPYNDGARIMNMETRKLLLDLNDYFYKEPGSLRYYVITQNDVKEDNTIEADTDTLLAQLVNEQGDAQTYVLILFQRMKSDNGPRVRLGVTTNHPAAKEIQGLNEYFVSDFYDDRRTDIVYFPEKAIGDFLKLSATEIGHSNQGRIGDINLKVKSVKSLPADIQSPRKVAESRIQNNKIPLNYIDLIKDILILLAVFCIFFSPWVVIIYIEIKSIKKEGVENENH